MGTLVRIPLDGSISLRFDVFVTDTCPHCQKARELLLFMSGFRRFGGGILFERRFHTLAPDRGMAVQYPRPGGGPPIASLEDLAPERTVPAVYVNGIRIAGGAATVEQMAVAFARGEKFFMAGAVTNAPDGQRTGSH